MASRFTSLVRLISRNMSNKGKRRTGLTIKTDSESVKKSRSTEMKDSKNRVAWETRLAQESLLKGKFCSDNVYFSNDYEEHRYSLLEAIQCHKEFLLDKAMLNSPTSVLNANFVLNMRTKKSTRFVHKIEGVIIPKHKLHFLSKPKILAFCITPEQIDVAKEKGAYEAGGEEIVKKLETGQIYYEEFDQAVSVTDALSLLTKLKPVLKDKLPTKLTKRVGDDIGVLVDTYVRGIQFESKKLEGIAEEAYLTMPLGQIEWPDDSLVENFMAYMHEICEAASTQILGDVISNVTLTCLPSDEKLRLDFSSILPRTKSATGKDNLQI